MSRANWLDKAIGFVSPQRGAARMQARMKIARTAVVRNLYEGASLGRRTDGWRAVGTDANAETRESISRLRDVARDMVRNNGYAARAKSTIKHNVVGAGIVPAIEAKTPKRKAAVEALLKAHIESTDIDADGRLNIYGLQALAMATIVEAGEVLIRRRLRRVEDGLNLPLQIQVLEPDFLDTSFDGVQPNGNLAVQGVEFDLRGKRVAYYLFDEHPGSTTAGAGRAYRGKRVSADLVAHVYSVDRPGQVRGVSWFAPVMVRMRDFADLADAQLIKQKIAACFAGFITGGETGELDEATGQERSRTGNPIENFEPGMIERLGEGESITFAEPPQTSDFSPYSTVTLREIAAGLNIPYEVLTGDLTGVNFSSGRMGWLEYQRSIDGWRWNMLIPAMLDPVARWLIDAVNVVTMSTEPFRIGWTPPRREMINPTEEIGSAIKAIRGGMNSRSDEIRKLGYDPVEVDREIAADNARADSLGIVLDSDPRKVSAAGLVQATPAGPA